MTYSWQAPEVVDQTLPFAPGRDFTVFSLTATHRQLLLRSPMGEEWEDRVDVVFKGVVAMKVNVSLPMLVIGVADDGQVYEIERECGLELRRGDQGFVYTLSAGAFSGFVVAASLLMARDHSHATNPSPLLFDIEGGSTPERIFRLV